MQIAMMHKLMDKGIGSEQGWMAVHDVFSFFQRRGSTESS